METEHLALARQLAAHFAPLPQVEAVALGGSRGGGGVATDRSSDIGVSVYTRGDIPLEVREGIVEASGGATRTSVGLAYWGPGDEWLNAAGGIHVDAVYFDAGWMEGQIERVLVRHEASLGHTTCFRHTVRRSIVLEDLRVNHRLAGPAGELLRRRLRRQPVAAPRREAAYRGGRRELPPAPGRDGG